MYFVKFLGGIYTRKYPEGTRNQNRNWHENTGTGSEPAFLGPEPPIWYPVQAYVANDAGGLKELANDAGGVCMDSKNSPTMPVECGLKQFKQLGNDDYNILWICRIRFCNFFWNEMEFFIDEDGGSLKM